MNTATTTNAKKQAKFRKEMRDQGYTQLYAWFSAEDKQKILDFAAERGQTVERAIVDALEEARAYREHVAGLLNREKHM